MIFKENLQSPKEMNRYSIFDCIGKALAKPKGGNKRIIKVKSGTFIRMAMMINCPRTI